MELELPPEPEAPPEEEERAEEVDAPEDDGAGTEVAPLLDAGDEVPPETSAELPDVSAEVAPDMDDTLPLESLPDEEGAPDWPLESTTPEELTWPLLELEELLLEEELDEAFPEEEDELLPEPALHVPLSQNAMAEQSLFFSHGDGRHPDNATELEVTTTLIHVHAARFMAISIGLVPLPCS